MKEFPRLAYRPVTGIPKFQHVAILRAVQQVLIGYAPFARVVNTFVKWDGTVADTWEPAFSLCPYCRITPGQMTAQMVTERQHSAPMPLTIDVAVQGTDYDNLGNFWGVIFDAIFDMTDMTRFSAVLNTLQAAGVTRPVMSVQASVPTQDNENNYMLIGRGIITFNSLLPL